MTDNLMPPWPPGVSGNPAGKPKGARNRSTIVREALEALAEDGKMYVDKATIAVLAKALDGDVAAFRELMDSGYGKNTDSLNLGGQEDNPVRTKITIELVKPDENT